MPEKTKKILRVVAAEVERNGQFLITQRREQALFPLYWEFPSGKVELGESDEFALARELQERLGVKVEVGPCTMFVKQDHEDYTLDFHVYQCTLPSDQVPSALKVRDWKWVHPHEMESYPFPPADAQTTRKLIAQESDED
jgi:8-oxo-dGTP diphosphatase